MEQLNEYDVVEVVTASDDNGEVGAVYYVVAVLSFVSVILSIYLWLFQISAIIYRFVNQIILSRLLEMTF